mmetsp:Transcript_107648/g.321973  ORF Transcript_107648/g.321973 Transcript_107648/m.321973 type:complete len:271 (+) Transcript_107648:864-1676(+)
MLHDLAIRWQEERARLISSHLVIAVEEPECPGLVFDHYGLVVRELDQVLNLDDAVLRARKEEPVLRHESQRAPLSVTHQHRCLGVDLHRPLRPAHDLLGGLRKHELRPPLHAQLAACLRLHPHVHVRVKHDRTLLAGYALVRAREEPCGPLHQALRPGAVVDVAVLRLREAERRALAHQLLMHLQEEALLASLHAQRVLQRIPDHRVVVDVELHHVRSLEDGDDLVLTPREEEPVLLHKMHGPRQRVADRHAGLCVHFDRFLWPTAYDLL